MQFHFVLFFFQNSKNFLELSRHKLLLLEANVPR